MHPADRVNDDTWDRPVAQGAEGTLTRFEPGDCILTSQSGGRGFGSPPERDPAVVLSDARTEYICLDATERDHGVVIRCGGPHNRDFRIDQAATAARRACASF